ncbi:MAG: glutamate--cysteine ligase [Pseudomonadota bacterium]
MKSTLEQHLHLLQEAGGAKALRGRKIGLEKESLRVADDGTIAQTDHPSGLGSALTHPSITTDYSEALIEMVTPAFTEMSETLNFLDATHRFIYSQLGNEYLWSTSMPCIVSGDKSVRIAEYGTSNAGLMKTIYRRGLGHRYGRTMQAIAGVHFNYSYPDEFWERWQSICGNQDDPQHFRSESYMGLVRNLQRYGWLVPYLFGASPAICRSFLGDVSTSLEPLFDHTYYSRYATSLRMGDIGYQNSKEGEVGINVKYNSLQHYIDSLTHAITTECPAYRDIPVSADGDWQQLNRNILQIENEHYSSVRPKQLLEGMEKPTMALARRGVAYIELRSLDVNVHEPLGISHEHMRFLESFVLFNLLMPSPPIDDAEHAELKHNQNTVAQRGRDPSLKLKRGGTDISLRDWANEIFDGLSVGCELLDAHRDEFIYCSALQEQRKKIQNPDSTPSAQILEEMISSKEEFFEFSLRHSKKQADYFASRPLDASQQEEFLRLAKVSLENQQRMEQSDTESFDAFIDAYLKQ